MCGQVVAPPPLSTSYIYIVRRSGLLAATRDPASGCWQPQFRQSARDLMSAIKSATGAAEKVHIVQGVAGGMPAIYTIYAVPLKLRLLLLMGKIFFIWRWQTSAPRDHSYQITFIYIYRVVVAVAVDGAPTCCLRVKNDFLFPIIMRHGGGGGATRQNSAGTRPKSLLSGIWWGNRNYD